MSDDDSRDGDVIDGDVIDGDVIDDDVIDGDGDVAYVLRCVFSHEATAQIVADAIEGQTGRILHKNGEPAFVLQERLGGGSYGVTYSAERSGDGSRVTVKLLAPRADFAREASFGRYRGPHFPVLVDQDQHHAPRWIAMEWIESTVEKRFDAGELDATQAFKAVQGTARALLQVHAAGCIHDDVYWRNVGFHDNVAVLFDFSLSRNVQGDPAQLANEMREFVMRVQELFAAFNDKDALTALAPFFERGAGTDLTASDAEAMLALASNAYANREVQQALDISQSEVGVVRRSMGWWKRAAAAVAAVAAVVVVVLLVRDNRDQRGMALIAKSQVELTRDPVFATHLAKEALAIHPDSNAAKSALIAARETPQVVDVVALPPRPSGPIDLGAAMATAPRTSRLVFAWRRDNQATVFDTDSWRRLGALEHPEITDVAATSGDYLLTSGGSFVRLWDARTLKLKRSVRTTGRAYMDNGGPFSADDSAFVVIERYGQLAGREAVVYDVNGSVRLRVSLPPGWSLPAISPKGDGLAFTDGHAIHVVTMEGDRAWPVENIDCPGPLALLGDGSVVFRSCDSGAIRWLQDGRVDTVASLDAMRDRHIASLRSSTEGEVVTAIGVTNLVHLVRGAADEPWLVRHHEGDGATLLSVDFGRCGDSDRSYAALHVSGIVDVGDASSPQLQQFIVGAPAALIAGLASWSPSPRACSIHERGGGVAVLTHADNLRVLRSALGKNRFTLRLRPTEGAVSRGPFLNTDRSMHEQLGYLDRTSIDPAIANQIRQLVAENGILEVATTSSMTRALVIAANDVVRVYEQQPGESQLVVSTTVPIRAIPTVSGFPAWMGTDATGTVALHVTTAPMALMSLWRADGHVETLPLSFEGGHLQAVALGRTTPTLYKVHQGSVELRSVTDPATVQGVLRIALPNERGVRIVRLEELANGKLLVAYGSDRLHRYGRDFPGPMTGFGIVVVPDLRVGGDVFDVKLTDIRTCDGAGVALTAYAISIEGSVAIACDDGTVVVARAGSNEPQRMTVNGVVRDIALQGSTVLVGIETARAFDEATATGRVYKVYLDGDTDDPLVIPTSRAGIDDQGKHILFEAPDGAWEVLPLDGAALAATTTPVYMSADLRRQHGL
ncbi:MAG: hypothetical protein IT383_01210 [Deltaproteobacteria bacterium]|nr:hypothetical protein [Deltaproteobacteria bacterium]